MLLPCGVACEGEVQNYAFLRDFPAFFFGKKAMPWKNDEKAEASEGGKSGAAVMIFAA